MSRRDPETELEAPLADRILFLAMILAMLTAMAAWTFHYAIQLS